MKTEERELEIDFQLKYKGESSLWFKHLQIIFSFSIGYKIKVSFGKQGIFQMFYDCLKK